MLHWIRSLDRVLRGEVTSLAALQAGEIDVPIWGLCVVIDALGLVYGLCMSAFNLANSAGPDAWKQVLACTLKVPALFLLTLVVTFPSLYVFNAMVGSRLTFRSMARLLVATLAVMLAVLASIGPIVAFFSLTTTSYPFAILLNVGVFGAAGMLGLMFLLRTLHRLAAARAGLELQFAMTADAVGPLDPSRNVGPDRSVVTIFRLWVIVFALVGTQMAWVLSPFVGHTNQKFVLFRPTGSNFFQGVLNNAENLAAGTDSRRGGHARE
jgi:hypothetical protein